MQHPALRELIACKGVQQVVLTDKEGLVIESMGSANNISDIISELFSLTEIIPNQNHRITIEAEEGFILADFLSSGGLLITTISANANQGKVRELCSQITSIFDRLD